MWNHQLRPAVILLLGFTLLTGLIYPLSMTLLAQLLFPVQANGSLISVDGVPAGSTLIGQPFDDPAYFWGRPSAVNYNGAASGGSNLGPTNPALLSAIESRIQALQAVDPDNLAPVPVDLVTTSASGLDPHISPAAANYQVARIAKARGLDVETVSQLVTQWTENRQWGFLGEPRVNVLQLNLALDQLSPITGD